MVGVELAWEARAEAGRAVQSAEAAGLGHGKAAPCGELPSVADVVKLTGLGRADGAPGLRQAKATRAETTEPPEEAAVVG